MICGYVHEGETPPDQCPVCGGRGDMFEKNKDREEDLNILKFKRV
jgi:rubredoxin